MTAEGIEPARVAVLGAGAVAQVVHLPILTRMRGVQVVGLHDTNALKASAIAQRFAIPDSYTSAEELWQAEDVDAVIVCTPNNLHEEQVIQGLQAGKYVFCERPLALTAEGAARALDAAGDEGRLMVGMNQRFRPDVTALKEFVGQGKLGEIHYVRTAWQNPKSARSVQGWRHQREVAGGGALMELGIQLLDLALWLLGYPEPRRIVAHVHTPETGGVEESALLLLDLKGGGVLSLDVTWSLIADRERQFLQFVGSRGYAALPPIRLFTETPSGITDLSPDLAPGRENPFTASYRQELAHFVEAVRGRQPIDPPTEHTTLMRIVEAAYRSAASGSEIHFDTAG